VLALLWRAQEQEGWVTEPAIRFVGDMLGMPYIRVLEVATFYTMFQLAPVGKTAHLWVCGTTPCMLRGSEALIEIARSASWHPQAVARWAPWEEVECLVAAPCSRRQIGKDTYEDLDRAVRRLLTRKSGELTKPGRKSGERRVRRHHAQSTTKDVERV
jgi:NADH-quinone oxidoreductase subunit E